MRQSDDKTDVWTRNRSAHDSELVAREIVRCKWSVVVYKGKIISSGPDCVLYYHFTVLTCRKWYFVLHEYQSFRLYSNCSFGLLNRCEATWPSMLWSHSVPPGSRPIPQRPDGPAAAVWPGGGLPQSQRTRKPLRLDRSSGHVSRSVIRFKSQVFWCVCLPLLEAWSLT